MAHLVEHRPEDLVEGGEGEVTLGLQPKSP